MKLPVQLVESFDDIQQNFEALQGVLTTPGSSLPFLQLLTPGSSRLTSGSSTATFSGASNTPSVSIAHGLGTVPQRFWAIPTNGFAAAFWMQVDAVGNWTDSDVSVAAFCYTTITATVTFDWLAIG